MVAVGVHRCNGAAARAGITRGRSLRIVIAAGSGFDPASVRPRGKDRRIVPVVIAQTGIEAGGCIHQATGMELEVCGSVGAGDAAILLLFLSLSLSLL